MRVLEKSAEAVQTARYLVRAGKDLPGHAVAAKFEQNRETLERLLSEETGTKFLLGSLQRVKSLVKEYLETGNIGELASPRNLRVLCYFLDSRELSDPTLYESERLLTLLQVLDEQWKDSFLTPLVLLILRKYGSTDVRRQGDRYLPALVRKHLPAYAGSRPVPVAAKKHPELVKNPDPSAFSDKIRKQGEEWFDACESAGIPARMMGTPFFGVALMEYARGSDSAAEYLEDAFLDRLEALSGPELVKSLIALMIERHGRNSALEARLTSQAFKRIGDPMIISRWRCGAGAYSRYNEILEAARLQVSTWINKQVLEYFFQKAEMDGGRKQFWSKYAGNMHQMRIAMHWSSFSGPKTFGNPDLDQWIRNRWIRVRTETTDIGLIMEYGDWAIVEIGTHGNACYIYSKDNPVLKNLKDAIGRLSDLKRTYMKTLALADYSGEGRFVHHDGWEYKLRNILKNKMGL